MRRNLLNHTQRHLGGHLSGLHELPQIGAVDVFHDEVEQRPANRLTRIRRRRSEINFSEVMNPNDARMIQPRQSLRFSHKAFGKCRIVGGFRANNLDRNQTIELRLLRLENRAHPALPQDFDNLHLRKVLSHKVGAQRYQPASLRRRTANAALAKPARSSPRFSRHSGHCPAGAEAGIDLRHSGQTAADMGQFPVVSNDFPHDYQKIPVSQTGVTRFLGIFFRYRNTAEFRSTERPVDRTPVALLPSFQISNLKSQIASPLPGDRLAQGDQFVIHILFARHGSGDFLTKQVTKSFPQPMHGHSQRAFGHLEPARDVSVDGIA